MSATHCHVGGQKLMCCGWWLLCRCRTKYEFFRYTNLIFSSQFTRIFIAKGFNGQHPVLHGTWTKVSCWITTWMPTWAVTWTPHNSLQSTHGNLWWQANSKLMRANIFIPRWWLHVHMTNVACSWSDLVGTDWSGHSRPRSSHPRKCSSLGLLFSVLGHCCCGVFVLFLAQHFNYYMQYQEFFLDILMILCWMMLHRVVSVV